MKKALLSLIFLLCFSLNLFSEEQTAVDNKSVEKIQADNKSKYKRVEADSINIKAIREELRGTIISKDDIERIGAADMSQALQMVPSVIMNEGSANGDTTYQIRGFSAGNIALLVDGVSQQNPFNSRSDAAGLLIADMEQIAVQKGYSSMLYGSNSIGGAIMLTTHKPKKKFELDAKLGFDLDNAGKYSGTHSSLQLGTKAKYGYLGATVQLRDIDHFRLSESYEPKEASIQGKGDRLFSNRSDLKTTIIGGITPIKGLDIWLNYSYLTANRGLNPPEASDQYSLWAWKFWENHNVSFNTEFENKLFQGKLTAFFNKFDNRLDEYSTLIHYDYDIPNTKTVYDQYVTGLQFKGSVTPHRMHAARLALSWKQESHKGYRNDKDDIIVKENKLSIAGEYEFRPIKELALIGTLGFDGLFPSEYWSRDDQFSRYMGVASYQVHPETWLLLAGQVGIFYDFIKNNQLYLTYARRNQFPSMNDRYSTRWGERIPNPALKPEMADHFELGYKGTIFNMLRLESSIYYSMVQDKMVTISVPDPFASYKAVDFLTNLDNTHLYGYEFALTFYYYPYIQAGLSFSVNSYAVQKSALKVEYLTYYPNFTLNSYLKVEPCKYFSFMPVLEYSTERYTDLRGFEAPLPSYLLMHLYFTINITDGAKFLFAVKNLLDTNYSLRKDWPLAGRTFQFSFNLKF